jgi:hypothetical protein
MWLDIVLEKPLLRQSERYGALKQMLAYDNKWNLA